MIYIVGIGPGAKDYMNFLSIKTLEKSHMIVGFERAIEAISFIDSEKIVIEKLQDILEFIKKFPKDKILSIVASGDPTFFGISEYIKKNVDKNIEVIPGISSFQYLTCKLNKSWSKAYTGSMHGREDEFLKKIEENDLSIWLCDKKNSPQNLCKLILSKGIECNVYIGENLSYKEERIEIGKPEKFINENFNDLSIFIVSKED